MYESPRVVVKYKEGLGVWDNELVFNEDSTFPGPRIFLGRRRFILGVKF